MGMVRKLTPKCSASLSAFDRVRAVVPKPGMVMATTPSCDSPARSKACTVTSSARVESSPPVNPMVTRLLPVWRSRLARPVAWMLKISWQ